MTEKSRILYALGACAAAAGMLASPVQSAMARLETPESTYLRARAAAVNGDTATAAAELSALLDHDPTNVGFADRAYRQGVIGGDEALALRAAHALDKLGKLPPDGRLLLALEAVRTSDWAGARATVDQLEKERLFAFVAPMLRAWIALGSRQGDPLALLDGARTLSLAAPYLPEQRALILIALGRVEEGVATLRSSGPSSLDRLPPRTRLLLAAALARSQQKDRALALLSGDEPAFVAARAQIAAGKPLPERVEGPAEGIASLLVNLAADFGRQRLAPVALTLGRFATFVAPQDASGWIFVGQMLAATRQKDMALAALDHVPADDPLATIARALRIALLTEQGNKQAALEDALKATRHGEATPAAWGRLGDVYMSLDRPKEAVAAYSRALDAASAARLPADDVWPLLLQQAAAMDQAGNWPAAKAALEKAFALAPNQPLVLNQLGYSEIAHRVDVARASGLIEQASRLRPDDSAITDSLGWSYFLRGQPDKALPLLEKAVLGAPGEPTINEHLGDVYWTTGRRYEARYAWRAALVTAEDKDKSRLNAKIDMGLSPATASP